MLVENLKNTAKHIFYITVSMPLLPSPTIQYDHISPQSADSIQRVTYPITTMTSERQNRVKKSDGVIRHMKSIVIISP